MKNSYLGQAWLVLLLALCFGGALAGVEVTLRDRIAENKKAMTFGKIPDLVPGAVGGTQLDTEGWEGFEDLTVYRAEALGGRLVGWVVKASGMGYADRIELLVGLNPSCTTITGLAILNHKETPGLGAFIKSDGFQDQFEGKKGDGRIAPVKSGTPTDQQIQAISGATISSQSVCTIINKAVSAVREKLAAMAGGV
jgi:Na+-translocating ferredoxin:NAD+ oxidoreductase subunit G